MSQLKDIQRKQFFFLIKKQKTRLLKLSCFFFSFFLATMHGIQDLSSLTRD